jgi:hypothetical protein
VYAASQDPAGNTETTVRTSSFKIDRTPPTVTCAAPDGAWHATDVTLDCTASDVDLASGRSGLFVCPRGSAQCFTVCVDDLVQQ